MVKNFLDILTRDTRAQELEKLDPVARKLETLTHQVAAILSDVDTSSRSDILAQFDAEVLACLKKIEAGRAGPGSVLPRDPQEDGTTSPGNSTCPATETGPAKQEKETGIENITPEMREWARQNKEALTPELLEWARQQINVEEMLASIREIQETGGLELRDFIQELEHLVSSP